MSSSNFITNIDGESKLMVITASALHFTYFYSERLTRLFILILQ